MNVQTHECGCATFGPGPHPVAARHPNVRGCEHADMGLDDRAIDAVVATLSRDDLCDETEGEHHTGEYVAAFLMALDTELRGRAALQAEPARAEEGAS